MPTCCSHRRWYATCDSSEARAGKLTHLPMQASLLSSVMATRGCYALLHYFAAQGEPWPAVIVGHEADPMTQEEDTKRLMLERFQREVSPPALLSNQSYSNNSASTSACNSLGRVSALHLSSEEGNKGCVSVSTSNSASHSTFNSTCSSTSNSHPEASGFLTSLIR